MAVDGKVSISSFKGLVPAPLLTDVSGIPMALTVQLRLFIADAEFTQIMQKANDVHIH